MPSATQDEKIAPTAHYTAYVWHYLGMPHGELFATPLGAAMFWGFRASVEGALPRLLRSVPSMTQYLELRHLLIESALEEADPDLVVELGAGLSRRGVTWAADRGVRYVEIDLPQVGALKRRLLAERASPELLARLSGRLTHVDADVLSDGFGDTLSAIVRGAARPIVIAEGVLGYFAPADRARLARSVARALDGRGAFVCELRTRSGDPALGAAVGVLRAAIRVATKGRGAREDFADLDHVRRFFREAGFALATPLEHERVPHLAGIRTPARVWRAAP
ncbi:MAG TPA: class I SAM-dependent methyltransferase [Sandaracinaceae bacterium]